MRYNNIVTGHFISRPNRFIAMVEIDGQEEICHVKNTGRCRELLIPGAQLFLQYSDNPARKTKYDVIGVRKNDLMVNMDSQVPNKIVCEWLKNGNLFSKNANVYPEKTYGNSRFDFYIEDGERKAFMEVKGVTLEVDGEARFPDAPTERGVKHIQELIACRKDGYKAYIIFVVQMKGVDAFAPNCATHPAFADALTEAADAGVEVYAVDCCVTPQGTVIDAPVPVRLSREGYDVR